MSTPKKHFALAGSERAPLEGAREIGPANPNEMVDVTIRLRSRAGKKPIVNPDEFTKPVEKRTILSRKDFEQRHGADADSIARVEAFAREHKLIVKEKSAARRTIILSGTVAAMNGAFGVQLKTYEHPSGKYRGRTGAVQLPAELQDVVEGVFGLDNRPQAKPHFRRRQGLGGVRAAAVNLSYTPLQVAAFYDYPTGVDGSGECIALIELGGGYNSTDLSNYWSQLNLAKTPNVSAVSVGNGSNQPTGDPSGPDGEVTLDIEVAGAIAPGANIVVYFAENTDAGFLNAITTAAHDSTNNPSVLSISWGGPESSWTQQAMTSMDEAFQSAAAMGVTVCVAAGDDGSTDGVNDGANHVDFPASSPNVLACGGTQLVTSGNTVTSETVWNELASDEGATGGGISDVFPLPSWQNGAGVPPSADPSQNVGRGVPDVAGDADPTTGYVTLVDGQPDVIGGTSAVAPLWAGLVALINQSVGKPIGFMNPLLYQAGDVSGDFDDITSGNNGAYSAGPGWDACTGLGSPVGTKIADIFSSGAQAAKTGT
ncbi:MAG TPA: S53 family peptidase [Candidatus Eremiobacteraceae bacterium]|nr:S53 family peptidase [Candidatus Eremiobacteraceae bacterium]